MFLKRDDDLKVIVDWCTNVGKHTAIGVKISPVRRPALVLCLPQRCLKNQEVYPPFSPVKGWVVPSLPVVTAISTYEMS